MKEKFQIIDLSHSLDENIPTWDGSCGFHSHLKLDYEKDGLRTFEIKCQAGIGTHIDAPSHFIKNSISIENISIENLLVPVCMIDVTSKVHPSYKISVEDIEQFE